MSEGYYFLERASMTLVIQMSNEMYTVKRSVVNSLNYPLWDIWRKCLFVFFCLRCILCINLYGYDCIWNSSLIFNKSIRWSLPVYVSHPCIGNFNKFPICTLCLQISHVSQKMQFQLSFYASSLSSEF